MPEKQKIVKKNLYGFCSMSIKRETFDEIKTMNTWFAPKFSRSGFIQELVDFYKNHHCPECCQCLAEKKKNHTC